MSCSVCVVMSILLCPSCSPFLFCLFYSASPVFPSILPVPLSLSCAARLALPFLFCLSSCHDCPGCHVSALLFWKNSDSPVPPVQSSSAWPDQPVLFSRSHSAGPLCLPRSDYPVLACLSLPVLPVPLCLFLFARPVLQYLSRFVCPVLDVLFWLSLSGCCFLAVLSQLSWLSFSDRSCPVCPNLAVLSWLSCPGCPVLAVLSWLFCPGCLVLFWLAGWSPSGNFKTDSREHNIKII